MSKIKISVESVEDSITADLESTPESLEDPKEIEMAETIDDLSCKIDTGLESISSLLDTKALLMSIANRKNDNKLISAMETRVLADIKEVSENTGLSLETSMIHAAASKIGSLLTWIKDGLIALWKAIVKGLSRIYNFVANFFKGSAGKEDEVEDIINGLNKTDRESLRKFKEDLDAEDKVFRKRQNKELDEMSKQNSRLYTDKNTGEVKKYHKLVGDEIIDVTNKKKGQPGYSHEDFSNAVFASAPKYSYMFLGKRGEPRFLDANEAKLDQLLSFAQDKLCVSTSPNYRNLIGKIYDLFHDLHFGNDLIPTNLKHFLDNSDSYDSKLSVYREKVSGKLEDIHTIQTKLINDTVGKDFLDSNLKVSRVTNSRYFNSFEFTFSDFEESALHNVNTLDPNTFKSILDTINKNINIFKFTTSDKIVELLYDKSLDLTKKIEETITKFSRSVDEKSLEGGSIDASVHRLSKYAHSLNEILTEAVKKLNTLINEIFKQHKATSSMLLSLVKSFRATVDYSLGTVKSMQDSKQAIANSMHK